MRACGWERGKTKPTKKSSLSMESSTERRNIHFAAHSLLKTQAQPERLKSGSHLVVWHLRECHMRNHCWHKTKTNNSLSINPLSKHFRSGRESHSQPEHNLVRTYIFRRKPPAAVHWAKQFVVCLWILFRVHWVRSERTQWNFFLSKGDIDMENWNATMRQSRITESRKGADISDTEKCFSVDRSDQHSKFAKIRQELGL